MQSILAATHTLGLSKNGKRLVEVDDSSMPVTLPGVQGHTVRPTSLPC
jgi:hypothetical protein